MALFATNVQVFEFNNLVMKEKGMAVVTIMAEDTVSKTSSTDGIAVARRGRTGRPLTERPYQEAQFDIHSDPFVPRHRRDARRGRHQRDADMPENLDDPNKTGGLMKELKLAVGGKRGDWTKGSFFR